jgi:uncharacterized DUF497 family protein
MAELRFEWDPKKNRENRRRHKVSFEEAETAFADEHGLLLADPDHSEDEDRFILPGLSATLRLLIVCHTYRVRRMKSFASFQPARRTVQSGANTADGGDNEKTLRLFPGQTESLR